MEEFDIAARDPIRLELFVDHAVLLFGMIFYWCPGLLGQYSRNRVEF